jgi:hypothetical protein
MTWPSEQTRAARESHHPCGASGGSGAGGSGAVASDAAVGSLSRDRTRERTVALPGEIAMLDGPTQSQHCCRPPDRHKPSLRVVKES